MDRQEFEAPNNKFHTEDTPELDSDANRLNVGFIVSDFEVPQTELNAENPRSVTEQWKQLLDQFVGESVELQPERMASLTNIEAIPIPVVTKEDGAIGVHHPSYKQDVISKDLLERTTALQHTINGYRLAHRVGALYYVVHPVTTDDWVSEREKQAEQALTWVTDLANYQAIHTLSPLLCIENLEVPKTPASTDELLHYLRRFADEGLPVGVVFDIAHHWHNYVNLFQYLKGHQIIDPATYLSLLTSHLHAIHDHFPEMLVAYHITQSYVDAANKVHVTHGLPGSLEGAPLNINGLLSSPDESLEWLSTADVLKVLKYIAKQKNIPVTRVILEVHHRSAQDLLPVAQAMMELWSK